MSLTKRPLTAAVLGLAGCMVAAPAEAEPALLNGLPIVRDRIGLAQIFIAKIPPAQLEQVLAKRDFTWGANPTALTFTAGYAPADRDNDRKRDEKWYRAHRPDWLVYKCDKTSLAHEFRYDFGYLTPIDITNEAVREYMFDTFVKPYFAKPLPALIFDNVFPANVFQRCGIYTARGWQQNSAEPTPTRIMPPP